MTLDQDMDTALALDGVKLEQLTGQDHGPWTLEPDHAGMWAEIESLDDAAREAVDRANGGPVFLGMDYSTDYLDREALMRIIGKISLGEGDLSAHTAVRTLDLRQSATETPSEFVKRITLALLKEMAGVE